MCSAAFNNNNNNDNNRNNKNNYNYVKPTSSSASESSTGRLSFKYFILNALRIGSFSLKTCLAAGKIYSMKSSRNSNTIYIFKPKCREIHGIWYISVRVFEVRHFVVENSFLHIMLMLLLCLMHASQCSYMYKYIHYKTLLVLWR